jgi:tetratricopeptide (TPR) repeat protein
LQEAQGEYDGAKKVYAEIIEVNSANSLVLKRQCAMLRAQGKIPEAIQALNKFIKSFQADASAVGLFWRASNVPEGLQLVPHNVSVPLQWHELADLYLSVGQYKYAAFCYEDLLLSDPMSYLLHCRLAEILYTIGGSENYLAARKYFSQSLHLKKNNPRALFGLEMVNALKIDHFLHSRADFDLPFAVHARN